MRRLQQKWVYVHKPTHTYTLSHAHTPIKTLTDAHTPTHTTPTCAHTLPMQLTEMAVRATAQWSLATCAYQTKVPVPLSAHNAEMVCSLSPRPLFLSLSLNPHASSMIKANSTTRAYTLTHTCTNIHTCTQDCLLGWSSVMTTTHWTMMDAPTRVNLSQVCIQECFYNPIR